MTYPRCTIQRRADGVLLVRIHSRDAGPATLPDAVFSFRNGDPQYERWQSELQSQEQTSQPVAH